MDQSVERTSKPGRPTGPGDHSWARRLSRIRHDLRNPLSEILGFSEILQEEAAERQLQPMLSGLATIHQTAARIFAEVNHALNPNALGQTTESLRELEQTIQTLSSHIISTTEDLSEKCDELENNWVGDDLLRIAGSARRLRETAPAMLRELADLFAGRKTLTDLVATEAAESDPAIAANRILGVDIDSGSASGSLLIVDDNEANRALLARHLRRQGFTVSLAENGRQALEKVHARPFDLVLLDVIMPEMGGYQVLETMKQDPRLRHIPVIMISALDDLEMLARCIQRGAEDYLSKPYDAVLLQARIGSSLEKKRLHDQEERTYRALLESQKRLSAELTEAASYVRSLLPPPLEGEVRVQWRFQPSAELGGDIFGYHWFDSDRLAIYLLDVSGHGVGAALLSVSVLNVLRTQSLQGTDFRDPAAVLKQLNRVFQMERQNNLLFTIWYGVWDRTTRKLTYASGGHPPALLLEPATEARIAPARLGTGGRVIGCAPEAEFRSESRELKAGSKLYVFSDGAYELCRPDGKSTQLADLIEQLGKSNTPGASKLDELLAWANDTRGGLPPEDDLSLLELEL